jgi:excisionase family DNA binding protein
MKPSPADLPPMHTPRSAAEALGVSVSCIHKWITSGALPAVRVGSRYRIPESSLAAVVSQVPAPAGQTGN